MATSHLVCKFFEMCAILFPSSTSWHTKANISVENKPSLSLTLFCCFQLSKNITCPYKLSSSLVLQSIIVGKVQICANKCPF